MKKRSKAAIAKDRKYTNEEEVHERRYKKKRKSPILNYKKRKKSS